jgi:beta-lactamase regulating signal transducer with metallopeptidase domain
MNLVITFITAMAEWPAAAITFITVLLLVTLAACQAVARSAAARHAILLWALIGAGLCPLLMIAVRMADLPPLITLPTEALPVNLARPSDLPGAAQLLESGSLAEPSPAVSSSVAAGLSRVLWAIWMMGALVGLLRIGRGLQLTWRIRRTARPLAVDLIEPALDRVACLSGRAPPQVLASDRIAVPMTVGCFRPVVIVPQSLPGALERGRLVHVLLHECAHAFRRDPLIGLYQRLLSAALWFHPLVYLANHLLDRAREELCDNHALRAVAPAEYSRTLLMVAQTCPPVPNGLPAPALFRSARQLEHRVAGLLNPRRPAMTRLTTRKSIPIVGAFIGGAFVLACLGGSPSARSTGYELSHQVPFELGAAQLREGDRITITEVVGTADTMTAGNAYIVRGTYQLTSAQKATLAAFVTDRQPERKGTPVQKTQSMLIAQGEGRFSLILYMWNDGYPHVSFYPAEGGSSLANVYFGTGDSLLTRGWWESSNPPAATRPAESTTESQGRGY